MNRTESRLTLFARIVLMLTLTFAPVVQAQPSVQQASAKQDVTIVIQQQQVRFTTPQPVEQMHLQVRDQAGEVVFDSGAAGVLEINWQLQYLNGAPLKSGLYAYTLTIKEAGKDAQARRGHFIVDRAQDRDGTDKLWITSPNTSGVGTELTVARDENAIVAGTTTGGELTVGQRGESPRRAGSDRGLDTAAQLQTAAVKTTTAAVTAGTAGQIAKFTSGTDLGNSVMTELNGNIGIGTTTPRNGWRLHVNGSTMLTPGGSGGDISIGTPNGETGMAITRFNASNTSIGPRADLRFNGSTLKLVVADAGGPPPNENGIAINTAGKVGMGTTAFSSSRLTIEGQDGLTLRGYEPFFTLRDSNGLGHNSHRIQSAHGDLAFFQELTTQFGYRYAPRLIIKDDGNVGIGTDSPATKLHVVGNRLRLENGGKLLDLRADGAALDLQALTHSLFISSLGPGGNNNVVINPFAESGNVGIGTALPQAKLHVAGTGIVEASVQSVDERAILSLNSTIAGQNQVWTLESGVYGQAGRFAIYDRTTNRDRLSIDTNGVVGVDTLQIRGGADFAEHFDVNLAETSATATTAKVQAGMVVSIDPASLGKLQLSKQAYDRRVAGIISGAGGVKPGMMMSQAGTLADGQHPVALSGRVYCWVDATRGAIEPGDLLTTSPTPGHAMKVINAAKGQGAIIGKAMTSLKSGKGLVLVLVTLQ